MTYPRLIIPIVLLAILAGCSLKNNQTFDTSSLTTLSSKVNITSEEGKQLIEQSYSAANTLAKVLKDNEIPGNQTIALTSFVNVDDTALTSTLGRLLPEQISSRLSQLGFATAELKERNPVIHIRNRDGEFSLSRNLPTVLKSEGFDSILAGSYAVGSDSVYVNVRVVRVSDQHVLAGADFALSATPGIQGMATQPAPLNTPIKPSVDASFGPGNNSMTFPTERPLY
ncbi:MAG: FlgO family outer membrane protein [Desulfovibrio sp.]|uniref:FlgO family outer membrane protein n=1 Tax=Desulfovibrio sp. 7SRBS1 TaxID=3378064 RepID=UPI003B3D3BDB